MQFNSKLQAGTLIRRYKRFLADITLDNGEQITIHCPNTGAMTGCATENDTVWYSTSNNPKRKYPNTWELNHNVNGHWICINTTNANKVVEEAVRLEQISELAGYSQIRTEVKYGEENSRIDLLLESDDKPACYVEVKSVTLLGEDGHGYFPDAVSTRGQKHIRELMAMKAAGHRAVLFFLVQHSGIDFMHPAAHVDKKYAEILAQAVDAGVEVLSYRTHIEPAGITIEKAIPFSFAVNMI